MSYRLVRQALTPLIVADCAGMVLAGGFILARGPWQVLWSDVLVFFMSPMVFPFLLVPAAMLAGFAKIAAKRRKGLADVLVAASVGWLIFVMAFGASWSFEGVSGLKGALVGPALLWGLAGGCAPWAVFARLDRENVFFTGLVVMQHIGCAAVAAAGPSSFWDRFWIVAGIMTALAALQAAYEAWFMKKKA